MKTSITIFVSSVLLSGALAMNVQAAATSDTEVKPKSFTEVSKLTTNYNRNTIKRNLVSVPYKATNLQSSQVVSSSNTETSKVEASEHNFVKEVIDLTNAERKKAGLQPLLEDALLMKNAQQKSQNMKDEKYFSHQSPSLGSPFEQMKANGITYKAAGENIAKGQKTPAQVVQAWMDSPGHRANILDSKFTHIGVGYVESGYIWTQQFIKK